MTGASGIGSWAGIDVFAAVDGVAQTVGAVDSAGTGVRGVPYMPELPARGPGADMIGRSAAVLAELAVDLQPSGWRLVDHAGVDMARASSFLQQDKDAVAAAFYGWDGAFKVSFVGPWTLAANLRLFRGERVLADEGAVRDVAQALGEGIAEHVSHIGSLFPQASVILQLDEPSLPAVLSGSLRTSSGYRCHAAVGQDEVVMVMHQMCDQVRQRSAVKSVVMHCCAPGVSVGLLRRAGADAVAVDVSLLDTRQWEECAEHLEAGGGLWTGVPVPLNGVMPGARELAEHVERPLGMLGLGGEAADLITVTPACGLAGAVSASFAAGVQARVVDAAKLFRQDVVA
ncbi:Uncharacterised protein [Dermatophilus congolensis]|uniref:Methionine synthase n=1 Tax=Dermatophilus congolensis TaxID=1863 RepID=A0AA46BLT4_9MICO|nr:methionine synthase [Dermatophilus congolensis]STD05105.1 Uncharacterised protein [Dermatophilus congolensis]